MDNKGESRGDGRRVQKVEKEVHATIAQYLISGFKNPFSGIVTVSRIRMTSDLKSAKVYVSVIGNDDAEDKEDVVETLNQRAFEVQTYISKTLKMRFCPKLKFFVDDTVDAIIKIEKLIDEVSKNKKEEDEL